MGLSPDSALKVSSTSPSLGEPWLDSKPTQQSGEPVSLRAELKELLIPIRAAVEETQKATWQEVREHVVMLRSNLMVLANQAAQSAEEHRKQITSTEASLAFRAQKLEDTLEELKGHLEVRLAEHVPAFERRTIYGLLRRAWGWFVRIAAGLWERK